MNIIKNRRKVFFNALRLFILRPHFLVLSLFIVLQANVAWTSHPIASYRSSCHQLVFQNSYITNANTARIPFQFVGRLIAVQALLDNQEGTFIFDTGASKLLVNERYVEASATTNTTEKTYSSVGEANVTNSTWVDSFSLDDLHLRNLDADIVDLSTIEDSRNAKISGIIGYSVFKDFEVFIDYQFRLIILTRVDKKGKRLDKAGIPEIPSDSLAFDLFKHYIVVKGYVGLEELKFNLDTGAEINLLDSKLDPGILENFKIIRRVNMIGVGDKKVEVLAGKFNGLVCGPGRPYPMRTLLANTSYIRKTTNVRVSGVLGFEFLNLKRISINYKKKIIYFYAYKEFKP